LSDCLSASLHLNETAPVNGERPPIGGLRLPCFAGAAASQATTAVGAHFISGGTSSSRSAEIDLAATRVALRTGRAPRRSPRWLIRSACQNRVRQGTAISRRHVAPARALC
jgi:hypothetical protein